MKKEFKRNINDEVWVMFNDRPVMGLIVGMRYCEFVSCIYFDIAKSEKYCISSKSDGKYMGEFELADIFDTKEDLIKSL